MIFSLQQQYFSPAQVESDQKDIIIAQLKAQIFELRKSEEDYITLQDELRKLEHKYKIAQQQKLISQAENKSRSENNHRNQSQYREDQEDIILKIKEQNVEIQSLHSDNLNLKEICEQQNIQISRMKSDISIALEQNLNLSDEQKQLEIQESSLKDEQIKFEYELDELSNENNIALQRGSELDRHLRELETEKSRLERQILQYQSENDNLENTLSNKNDELQYVDSQILESIKNIRRTQQDIRIVQNQNDQTQSESLHFLKNYQIENSRNQDLNARIITQESVLKTQELQIDEIKNQIDGIHLDNTELQQANGQLTSDLQACQKHIDILRNQNLENISDQDQQVRQILNRRLRVQDLRLKAQSGSSKFAGVGSRGPSPLKKSFSNRFSPLK